MMYENCADGRYYLMKANELAKENENILVFRDLPDYLRELAQRGWLRHIKTEVDPVLEITEIVDRVAAKQGPALFFSHVKGSPYPLAINLFGSRERMSLALGVPDINQLGERFSRELELLQTAGTDLMAGWKGFRHLRRIGRYFPQLVKRAPCQEVVEKEPDLARLPILQCWPQDGGKTITLPLVFTKDPATGRPNCGMYRMQVYDGRTTGMHWHVHKDGALNHLRQKGGCMEAAVALGGAPAVIYAATAPLPPGMDEMLLAGFLQGVGVEMVKCVTVDLLVPAHAEFILEGYVEVNEKRLEGPFGDHTGYYSLPEPYPVFHMTCLTRRQKPVYPATIVGRTYMEDYFLGKVTERLFLPLLKLTAPEISDLNLPAEGVFHNCAVVSIKKTYPGQARKVMMALWGLSQLSLTKTLIVVDDDIDVQDMPAVWHRTFSSIDARRDVVIMEGPLDALDHASPLPRYGGKMGIDATRKGAEEGHPRPWPEPIVMTERIKDIVKARWREYE